MNGEQLKELLDTVSEKVRKETAREIAEKLKAKAWQGYQVGMYIVSTDEIDEIAKQYGVEDKQ